MGLDVDIFLVCGSSSDSLDFGLVVILFLTLGGSSSQSDDDEEDSRFLFCWTGV